MFARAGNSVRGGPGQRAVTGTPVPRSSSTHPSWKPRRPNFEAEYAAKYPKAVASLRRDWEKLLTFYDYPAEHWIHLRTTNVIESPFATVRLRQRVTKGPGSRTKALTMSFKLLDMASMRWRRINGPALLPLVASGVKFEDGTQKESEGERAA